MDLPLDGRSGLFHSLQSLAMLILAFNNPLVGGRLFMGSTCKSSRLESPCVPSHVLPHAPVGAHIHRSRAPILQVMSPFKPAERSIETETARSEPGNELLDLNRENVELVLNEMRPYLVADGGNVTVVDIDEGVVKLQLQGACHGCPSSTVTMSNGLERGLLAKIPDIVSVQQVFPTGSAGEVTEEGVEVVLEEIRKFLKNFKTTVKLVELQPDGAQPTVRVAFAGPGAKIAAVRQELIHRVRRKFPVIANVVIDVSG